MLRSVDRFGEAVLRFPEDWGTTLIRNAGNN